MTTRDKQRAVYGLACEALTEAVTPEQARDELPALIAALTGLQSTDDPALLPLHDRLMERYHRLKKLAGDTL